MLRSSVKLDVKTITGIEESLFCTLKLSYDNLVGDTPRECFLCCAQWPEDERIPGSDLTEYLIGFGLMTLETFEKLLTRDMISLET